MFEMVQLWVNLPARDKMSPPHYQSISNNQIPVVNLHDNQGSVRVIAGQFDGATGPARTFTPIYVWDLHMDSDQEICLPVPDGYNALLAVLKGSVHIGAAIIGPAEVGMFDQVGEHICIDKAQNVTALLLCGEPIDEPIVGSGPFVMNSSEEIRQAMIDYQSGKMGQVPERG